MIHILALCYPFKIISTIICLISVLVVYLRFVVWIRYKRFCYKSVESFGHWLQRDAVDFGGLLYWKRNTTFEADTPQTEREGE